MGFSPREIDRLTAQELHACIKAFRQFHGVEEKLAPPSPAKFHAMVARHQSMTRH